MAVEIKNNREGADSICRDVNHRGNDEVSCVCRIVRDILQRQKEAVRDETCLNCQGRLGRIGDTPNANTRPFILYLPNGEEFSIRTTPLCNNRGPVAQQPPFNERTSIFRVEEIRGCCALLRGLVCSTPPGPPGQDQQPPGPPTSTLQCTPFCCWADLNEFVAVQCFSDAFVNIPCPIVDTFPPGPPQA